MASFQEAFDQILAEPSRATEPSVLQISRYCFILFVVADGFLYGDESLEWPSTFGQKLIRCLLMKMMYVSGETAEASPETTGMIEEIVRQQVIEMVHLPTPS
jgi:hypothetical protein